MPILWRYILSQYFKVLFLCATAFVAILLTMRLEEIAHFITLGSEGIQILWFIVHQIPYVLPIAIPVSCLISSTLLVQRLSISYELTALRASGLGLRQIFAPLLIAGALLSIVNFYTVSELASRSHLFTGLLKTELRALNPLLLMHNKHLMRLRGFYYDSLGHSKLGENAADVILAAPNKKHHCLNLIIAKNLKTSAERFTGDQITLISSIPSDNPMCFDHLVMENIDKANTTIEDFSHLMEKKAWTLNNDHLQLPLLLAHLEELKNSSADKKHIRQVYTEILRRISVGCAALTFTFMGAAFGMSISRYRTKRGIIWMTALTAFYLIAYFIAKASDMNLFLSGPLYILPHLIICYAALASLQRMTRGIE